MFRFFVALLILAFPFSHASAQQQILYNVIVSKPEGDSIPIKYEIVIKDLKTGKKNYVHPNNIEAFTNYLITDLSQHPEEKQQLLCYIHGMFGSNRWNFNHAIGLLLNAFVDQPGSDIACILAVKWPGNGMEYKDNKSRVYKIDKALSTTLSTIIRRVQLVGFFNHGMKSEVDLLAHSLGNELFKEVLLEWQIDENSYRYFDQIILAAPDLDTGLFNDDSDLANLPLVANRTHVYFSSKDLTLQVSKNLNKKDRLGIVGPTSSDAPNENIHFVDVSNVKDESSFGERITGHSYYWSSKIATEDMLFSLMGKDLKAYKNRSALDSSHNTYLIEVDSL